MNKSSALPGVALAAVTLTGCGGGGGGSGFGFPPGTVFTLGGTVSGLSGCGLTLQNNGVDNGSGSLPCAARGSGVLLGGLLLPSGTAYNVTVKTQPTRPRQICVVTNGIGTIGNADITTIAVTCTTLPGRFVYVANGGSSNISAYSINATSGELTAIAGSPFPAGNVPYSVAVDPSGKFAYVANQGDGSVSAFAVDATSGALTTVSGSPFAAGPFPQSVTVDPSDRFVYVTNGNAGNVSAYTINAGSGALTAVVGSPFAAGNSPHAVTVYSPKFGYNATANAFAYVANGGSNDISAYTINGVTGALTAVGGSPFAAGNGPRSVALDPSGPVTSSPTGVGTVDPSGKFAYVANANSNNISAYTINGNTGALTAVSGSPFAAGVPYSAAVDPAVKFLFVTNEVSNSISAYTINTSGALTAVSGAPFAAGSAPWSVTVDPSGKFVYVANASSSNISVYAIDAASGMLTVVTGSPFAAGSLPYSIAVGD